jgi:hypothetical protein
MAAPWTPVNTYKLTREPSARIPMTWSVTSESPILHGIEHLELDGVKKDGRLRHMASCSL